MLTITTLGGLQLHIDDQPITFAARRAEVLLVYLAMTERVHERETIAAMLWDDRTQRQTMANLRSLLAQLPKPVKPFVQTTRKTITVANIRVDATTFEATEDLSLYGGDFLQGVFLSDSRGLEEWAAVTRERLRGLAGRIRLERATMALYQRDYENGIEHARALVQLEPLRESARRLLMRLLVRDGQTTAALVEYERLKDVLSAEMSIPPSAATERLYRRITHIREQAPQPLPAQFTPFIGRNNELAQIAQQLDDPACRLLTLHGTGGVGKTRLAVEVAKMLQSDFMHGVYFVSLDAVVENPGAVLAERLGVQVQNRPIADCLIAHLTEKETLIVLDNAEHLIVELQPLIDRLLHKLPLLHLLVTSRNLLKLSAEWVFPLSGLRDHGIELFAATVRRTRPDFVADDHYDIIRDICTLLNNLPLGIELAATTAHRLPITQLAATIASNLDQLANDRYGIPARQRSLRAAFNASWQLLSRDERQLLADISVFQPGFDAAAVEAVTGQGRLLSVLLDKALVQRVEGDRFALHPAIRAFSAEKPPGATIHDKHSKYYARFAYSLREKLSDDRQIDAINRLEQAQPNLELGFQHALDRGDEASIDQFLSALYKHYDVKSRFLRAVEQFQKAKERLQETDIDRRVYGRLLTFYGFHLERAGDLKLAEENFDEATALLGESDEQEALLLALSHRGVIAFDRGDFPAAQAAFQHAIEQAKRFDDRPMLAHCYSHLGYLETAMGDLDSAEKSLRQSIELWRSQQTPRGLVIALHGLANLYEAQGKLDEAYIIYTENLTVCRQAGDAMGEVRTLKSLGSIALENGDTATARLQLAKAIEINDTTIHNGWLTALLSHSLGEVALAENDPITAVPLFEQTLALCEAAGDKRGIANARFSLGRAALLTEQLHEAINHFHIARSIAADNMGGRFLQDIDTAILRARSQLR